MPEKLEKKSLSFGTKFSASAYLVKYIFVNAIFSIIYFTSY